MSGNKTEILNRERLIEVINQSAAKHAWLAREINVSEKTLSRWLSGEVERIRTSNLTKLSHALCCDVDELIAISVEESYSNDKNRDVLVNELYNDSLLYELLMEGKTKLAISLIKSTFHARLPSAIVASFYVKLGYACVIQSKLRSAKQYFTKALARAEKSNSDELRFSAYLAFAVNSLMESRYKECLSYLQLCDELSAHAASEEAHFHSTYALYYLHTGQPSNALAHAELCELACEPTNPSVEKKLFLCTALQIKTAVYLLDNRIDDAFAVCKASLSLANVSGYSRCISLSEGYLSVIYACKGDAENATAHSAFSLEQVKSNDIAHPTLVCLSIAVSRLLNNTETLATQMNMLKAHTPEHSASRAFASYQAFLSCYQNQQFEQANAYRAESQSLAKELAMEHWLSLLEPRL
ncbi:helix-turn-helix transcriptional regulator [Alteromonas sp. KUL49]|uniref:helix-turn-helix domain-containing protein n=1 Tax=Alteromonas sp. KUL49 TaxID=2480798 RepID=UPI00102EE6FC|nr:helix-turn-helix transcriptional regulator [Alteromonas sp. KUL49]TAP40671.1 XRE family transcriptional regulator [Alteromonas sp. KUL49]GEA10838.1 hypothetical protein KUL49_12130 [Alteromonas sp. KUL49]